MAIKEIYQEIEEICGFVPMFFKALPENVLEDEWELFKHTQVEETAVPAKYKHLAGLAVAAAIKCPYCTLFHTELAKLQGATEDEIKDILIESKETAGWSAFLHGSQIDLAQFKQEVQQAVEYMREQQAVPV